LVVRLSYILISSASGTVILYFDHVLAESCFMLGAHVLSESLFYVWCSYASRKFFMLGVHVLEEN